MAALMAFPMLAACAVGIRQDIAIKQRSWMIAKKTPIGDNSALVCLRHRLFDGAPRSCK
jgi:hypothetical protein